jgi:hypothetical protein
MIESPDDSDAEKVITWVPVSGEINKYTFTLPASDTLTLQIKEYIATIRMHYAGWQRKTYWRFTIKPTN